MTTALQTLDHSHPLHNAYNKILQGTITQIEASYVSVDVGFKSEGLIPLQEFVDDDGVAIPIHVGDPVEVVMLHADTGYGDAHLSFEQARFVHKIEELEAAFKAGKAVEGKITGSVKGGLMVSFGPVTAFLPLSLVDVRPVKDLSSIEGTKQLVKIIKLNARRNNIVVSRRAVIDSSQEMGVDKLLSTLAEGQVLKGVVKSITHYGAFVDIGGMDGLLHITDMAWHRVKHPSEIVHVGEEVEVKVLSFDREKQRAGLGMKQLTADPWMSMSQTYKKGTRLKGKVTTVVDYGAFVEIAPGLEGLVHVTEMSWTNKNCHPSKIVTPGAEVDVVVLEVREEKRQISLGMKQCLPNPYEEFSNQYKCGDKIKGQIRSITDFGVFIGLPGGMDGLIHLTDLSATEPGEVAVKRFNKGDEVEATIRLIDPEKERIGLSLKQVDVEAETAPAKSRAAKNAAQEERSAPVPEQKKQDSTMAALFDKKDKS